MGGYWFRHRFLLTILIIGSWALLSVLLFVYPVIKTKASDYNDQSIYVNSDIDFIAPAPSYEQVRDLPGQYGIDAVFPFYMTNIDVEVNHLTRETTVLLSDLYDNLEMTMYNSSRLLSEADEDYANRILVDWQFCHDTSAKLGDTVSITIGGSRVDFQISAIYETNSQYSEGAILALISDDIASVLKNNSQNSGYSGMYVSADNYDVCRDYLTNEYRPLGRLRDSSQFDSIEQYQIHYETIMSSGYAKEITDYHAMSHSDSVEHKSILALVGTALTIVILISFNVAMSKRGSEQNYFSVYCMPKGIDVKPYYRTSFGFELVLFFLVYISCYIYRVNTADLYIPMSSILCLDTFVVPVGAFVSELCCLAINTIKVNIMIKVEKKRKEDEENKEETGEFDTTGDDIT